MQEYIDNMIQGQLVSRGISDERVLEAFRRVPRHLFTRPGDRDRAYGDGPLPIGEGQTISQPYIVALMSEALGIKRGDKVLEIGTGSGYQTAILAELGGEVYTVEKIEELGKQAREVLLGLGYDRIFFRVGDGTTGWPEEAPFQAVMVTAASPRVPGALWGQLAEGGRMVIPVGDMHMQSLLLLEKREGEQVRRNLGGCRFVPLLGEDGW